MSSVGMETYFNVQTERTTYAFDYSIVLCFEDNELSAFFEWQDEEVGFHLTSSHLLLLTAVSREI